LTSQVGARVEYFKKLLLAVTAVIIVLALAISVTTMVCINRSLKRMTETFTAIVETGDFTKSAVIKNNDEFGVTIRAFNGLVDSFTCIIRAVSVSSNKLSGSSRGLTGTAQEIHTTIGSQSANIGQVSAAAIEMSQTVALISENTSKIASAADDARMVAVKGADVVGMTGNEVQQIAQVVRDLEITKIPF